MPTLALAYLRDRALTTLLNVLLLGLAVATLVILLLFSNQIGERFSRDAAGIDLVVGAKGSPLQLILSSIYQIDAPTGNIPLESVALLRRDPSIAQVVPIALGDSFRSFRIVGTEPAYLALHNATIADGRMFAGHGEVVVGAEVARRTGMTLGQRFLGNHGIGGGQEGAEHHHSPFIAVGILAPTGTVIDRLILTSVETVWDVHGIHHDDDPEGERKADAQEAQSGAASLSTETELKPEVTALLVRYRNALGAVRVPGMVNRQTNMQAAVPAVETARLLSLLGIGIDAARLLAWLLALTGGLSIFVALLNAAAAREGDLALIRVMGATPGGVVGTILLEGLSTAAAGAGAGLLVGHGVLALAKANIRQMQDIGIDPWRIDPGELWLVAAVLAIGVVAALIPALRVLRTDIATTLARAA
jgi:putative ABC transport system permease protein